MTLLCPKPSGKTATVNAIAAFGRVPPFSPGACPPRAASGPRAAQLRQVAQGLAARGGAYAQKRKLLQHVGAHGRRLQPACQGAQGGFDVCGCGLRCHRLCGRTESTHEGGRKIGPHRIRHTRYIVHAVEAQCGAKAPSNCAEALRTRKGFPGPGTRPTTKPRCQALP